MRSIEERVELGIRCQRGPWAIQWILESDDGDVLRRQRNRGRSRLVLGVDHRTYVVAVSGLIRGPHQLMATQQLRPQDFLHPCFQPVNQTVVWILRHAACIQLGQHAPRRKMNVIEREPGSLLDFLRPQVGKAAPFGRQKAFSQFTCLLQGHRLLDHIDNLESQGHPRLRSRPCVAEQFNEDAAFMVEGMQIAL